MVVEDVLNVPTNIALELGRIGNWIQAVGLVVVIWIIIQSVTLFFNRRRRKTLYAIRDDLKRLEEKVDNLKLKKKG